MAVEMTPATAAALPPYLGLFHDLIDGRIDATAFETRFLHDYLADSTMWDDPVFAVLDRVFADTDAYVEDDDLRPDVVGAIDGDELRRSVAHAIAELEAD